jgi:hypothetical protein
MVDAEVGSSPPLLLFGRQTLDAVDGDYSTVRVLQSTVEP